MSAERTTSLLPVNRLGADHAINTLRKLYRDNNYCYLSSDCTYIWTNQRYMWEYACFVSSSDIDTYKDPFIHGFASFFTGERRAHASNSTPITKIDPDTIATHYRDTHIASNPFDRYLDILAHVTTHDQEARYILNRACGIVPYNDKNQFEFGFAECALLLSAHQEVENLRAMFAKDST